MGNVYAKQLQQQQITNQGKKRKKWIIVLSVVLTVIVGAITTLSLFPARTYNKLNDNGYLAPSHIEIFRSGESIPTVLDVGTNAQITENYNNVESAFKRSSFTIMRGWLEGHWRFGIDINLEYDEEDEDKEDLLNPVNPSTINSLSAPVDSYLVYFCYTTPQTVTIRDTEITYDRFAFVVTNEGNKLTTTQFYFFELLRLTEEEYHTYETHYLGNMERLHMTIAEMFEDQTEE